MFNDLGIRCPRANQLTWEPRPIGPWFTCMLLLYATYAGFQIAQGNCMNKISYRFVVPDLTYMTCCKTILKWHRRESGSIFSGESSNLTINLLLSSFCISKIRRSVLFNFCPSKYICVTNS